MLENLDKDSTECEECGKENAEKMCSGCGERLCDECSNLEILSYGCGNVLFYQYCEDCLKDESKNLGAWAHKEKNNS